MNYMLLIYGDERVQAETPEPVRIQVTASYMAYADDMRKAGVLLGAERLKPTAMATTVRVTGGETQVLDGPFAETREQLAGYFLIDVADLDAALAWAARCPGAARGAVEIRPLWPVG